MKYIIFDVNGLPAPAVFADHLQHRDVAQVTMAKVVSAGFVEDGKTFGHSESLGVSSREGDGELIKTFIR